MQLYVKDKHIRIYQLETIKDLEGFDKVVKHYIHPDGKYINAYYRSLKTSEIIKNQQLQDSTSAFFIIGRRRIFRDMYIEYLNRKTYGTTHYRITGVDPYEDNTNDIKVSVEELNTPPVYDMEEFSEW